MPESTGLPFEMKVGDSLRQVRNYLKFSWQWAHEHKGLIARYTAVGTVASLVSMAVQAVFVEAVRLEPEVAYVPQFFIVLAFYFWMLTRFVVQGDCYTWREYFHRVGVVKAVQLGSGLVLYKLFLIAGARYILALAITGAVLTVPFFIATVYGALKKSSTSEEATA